MAVVTMLVGVANTTTTDGTGTYTLGDPTGTNRRSLEDAVNAGHISNNDEVYACIFDETTSGASYEFEFGKYTVGSGGQTLARTEVIQSSNNDNAVDWDSGGTRTVVFGAGAFLTAGLNLSDLASASTARTNLDVPGLEDLNQFNERQVIQATQFPQLNLRDDSGDNHVQIRLGSNLGGASIAQEWAFRIASGSDILRLRDITGGTDHFLFHTDGSLQDGSGNKYDAFPSGFQMLASEVPTGWQRVNEANNRVPIIAGSGEAAGTQAGSWTVSGLSVSGTVGGHALTESELPSHTHQVSWDLKSIDNSGADFASHISPTGGSSTATDSAGSGNTHTHTWSGNVSSNGSWRPAYEIWLKIEKD